MSETRKRYRVCLVSWGSYVQSFDAESAEHAMELAEQDYCEFGYVDAAVFNREVDIAIISARPSGGARLPQSG